MVCLSDVLVPYLLHYMHYLSYYRLISCGEISVFSSTATFGMECSCLVFFGSLGICFMNLWLGSCDSAPMTLNFVLKLYLAPDMAHCALSLNSMTVAFCINK